MKHPSIGLQATILILLVGLLAHTQLGPVEESHADLIPIRASIDGGCREELTLGPVRRSYSDAPGVPDLVGRSLGSAEGALEDLQEDLLGQVLDTSGRPLPTVTLNLASGPQTEGALTDENGQFRLPIRSGFQSLVRASKRGYVTSKTAVLMQAIDGERTPIRITLVNGSSISGRLLLPAIQIANLRTWTERDGQPVFGLRGPRKTSDLNPALDSFRFEDLEAGIYRVCAIAPGLTLCVSEPIRLDPGAASESVVLDLTIESILFGSVLSSDGTPSEASSLYFDRLIASDGSHDKFMRGRVPIERNGEFRIIGLGAGSYRLRVEDPESALTEIGVDELLEGEHRYQRIFLPATSTLEGVARQSNGSLAPMRTVTLSSRHEGFTTRRATTDAEGLFRFPSLPVGEYLLEGRQNVSLNSGAATTLELQLEDLTNLRGQLRSVTGAGVRSKLVFTSTPGDSPQKAAVRTDDFGAFELSDVVPGKYVVRAFHAGLVHQVGSIVIPPTGSYQLLTIVED